MLHGERVTVYERKNGWAWVQAANDGYVGYLREECLSPPFAAQLQISALMTPVFSKPDLKSPVRDMLPFADSKNDMLDRGDILFWKGHMGVMLDAERLLHANAFHMMVVIEPVTEAIARIEKIAGPVTSVKTAR